MIASGESLKDVLNDLCCSIDVQASPVIRRSGESVAGPHFPPKMYWYQDSFSLSFLEVPSSRFRQSVFEPVSRNYINL
jgi:hypothetical protein